MSVFKEVYGTRCLGQTDPQCVNFVNKKILPPTKRFCDCASKVEQLDRTNWKAVGVAVVLGLVLAGGVAYAAYSNIPSVNDLLGSFFGHDRHDSAPPGRPSEALVSLRIETDSGTSVPIEHPFQSGDRFRFLMRGPSSERVYIFYEDRTSHKMAPLAAGPTLDPDRDLNVPTDGKIKLDDTPGRETFQFVVSGSEVPGLEGTQPLDRASFDDELSRLKRHGGLATGRFQSKDGGIRMVASGERATVAQLDLVHK